MAWEAEKLSEVAKGTHLAPAGGKKTLREYYETQYKPRKEWAPGTVRAHDQAMKFCPFAERALRDINRTILQDWVASMRLTLKPLTVRTRYATIRGTLAAATRDRLIPFNPCTGIDLPSQKTTPWDIRIPTTQQVSQMLSRSVGAAHVALAAAAFNGLRASEIVGLQPRDITPPILKIRRQIRRVSRGVVEPVPPKYGSYRDIPLPTKLADLLMWQAESVGATGQEWLFPGNVAGNPISYASVRDWLLDATSDWAAEIRHLHALRHYYASALIGAKCDVVTVQRALGHKNPSMTLDVYSHLWETSADEVLEATTMLMSSVYTDRSALSPQSTGIQPGFEGCHGP
ncbi:tyrosine-type recombinase/integrase [Rothia koreensis]|uniref:tyrosine-type recombinase/integrase n=1 Tax=Rothia koreensis TaxID=592378 RepID=UPI0037CB7CC8